MVAAARSLPCLAAALVVACADRNGPDVPAALTIVAGNGQIDTIDATLVDSLAVRVTNASGRGMGMVLVSWNAGSGAVRPESTATDPSGLAKAQWTLGSDPGHTHVTVSLLHLASALTDSFTATVNAGRATSLLLTSGSGRITVGGRLPIAAIVRDRLGHTVVSPIQWTSSDPRVATVTDSVANTPGVSGFGVVHPVAPGSAFIVAQNSGLRDSTAVVVLEVPAALSIVAGNGQIDTIDAILIDSLTVRLTDASGRGIGMALVGWSRSSGFVHPESTVTDASGIARAQWQLGQSPSQAYVTVSLLDPAPTLTNSFNATVNAGRAVYLRAIPYGDSRIMMGGTLAIAATARDRLNHLLGHSAIQWTSSDPAVATVTDSAPTTPDVSGFGVVHPVGVGRTFITAQNGGLRDSVAVVVVRDTAVFGRYDLRQRDSVAYSYCQFPSPIEVWCFSGSLDIDGFGAFVAKRYTIVNIIPIDLTLVDSSVTTGTYQVVSPCELIMAAAGEPQGSALKNLDSLVVTSDPMAPAQHRWVYRGSARRQACP